MKRHSVKISEKNYGRIWNIQMLRVRQGEEKPSIDDVISTMIEAYYPRKKHPRVYLLDDAATENGKKGK